MSSLLESLIILLAATLGPNIGRGFNDSTVAQVQTNLLTVATESWELGTAAEALLELSWPALSVFDSSAFPPPSHLSATATPSDVFTIAKNVVSAKPADSLALIADQGSAGDPASIGVAVLLANWTRTNTSDHEYADAASGQLQYLLDYAPRSPTGAISHRTAEVQLWADFVYMAPPFISYYGALQGGQTGNSYLQAAYDQCRLYRDALRDESGLWRHITLGSYSDDTHWATGNAWAAAGMLRVLSTLNHTSGGKQFLPQQANLIQWINEITEASWAHQTSNGSLLNVIDDPTSFSDMSATALLALVTYRMAIFQNDTSQIVSAAKAFDVVTKSVSADGWLQNVVDPNTFDTLLPPTEHSPEGQAFVLLLQSAWNAFNLFIGA